MANSRPVKYPSRTRPRHLMGLGLLRITGDSTSVSLKLCARLSFLALFIYLLLPQASSYGQEDTNRRIKEKDTALTLSCTADPTSVQLGEAVMVTAKVAATKGEPDVNDFIYSFGSSAGTLIVKGDSATLNTAGIKPKTVNAIHVVCSAVKKGKAVVTETQVIISPTSVSAAMTATGIKVIEKQPSKAFELSATLAPTLSGTTGTQTQAIFGGGTLLSAVKSNTYCDADMLQFGIAGNASDTGTTKAGASTINLDNNDVKVDATAAVFGHVDPNNKERRITNSYLGIDADFFGNNSLGIGLQQTYAAEYQRYLRNCSNNSDTKDSRWFGSVGVGAGFMSQRLYKTSSKLNEAVLPLSGQFSYLLGESSGKPPRLIWYGLLGYLPVLSDMHAYQLSALTGLQIPTNYPWLTVTLSESELYMNNAPTGFKRNYQTGSLSLAFTFPPNPPKVPNPAIKKSDKGACYGGDKLARLYCYDEVTIDACAPPNMFRRMQHCSSSGFVPLE